MSDFWMRAKFTMSEQLSVLSATNQILISLKACWYATFEAKQAILAISWQPKTRHRHRKSRGSSEVVSTFIEQQEFGGKLSEYPMTRGLLTF